MTAKYATSLLFKSIHWAYEPNCLLFRINKTHLLVLQQRKSDENIAFLTVRYFTDDNAHKRVFLFYTANIWLLVECMSHFWNSLISIIMG